MKNQAWCRRAMMMLARPAWLAFLVFAFPPFDSVAATITWVGPTTGTHLWSSPSNWPEGRLPTAEDDVRIEGEGTQLIVQVLGTATAGSLDSSCTIQVIGSLAGLGTLNVATAFRNRGLLQLMSERSDRLGIVNVSGTGLENFGVIRVESENLGGRQINGGIINRGQIVVEPEIHLAVNGANKIFLQATGTFNVEGTCIVTGGQATFTGGAILGGLTFLNSEIAVASSFSTPSTVNVLGVLSRLASNASPAMTLHLTADVGSNTTLTSNPGAVNNGTILMGSSHEDRNVRLETGSGLINAPSGRIEAIAGLGGARSINGTLFNEGRVVSTGIPLVFTGTYEANGGICEGDLRFRDVIIIPVKSPTQPSDLMLFGSQNILEGNNVANLNLRVISDAGSHARLTLAQNSVNNGTISLESLRPDRTTTLGTGGFTLENRGAIKAVALNGGSRALCGSVNNHGLIEVEEPILLTLDNSGAVLNQLAGSITVKGSLLLSEGRFNLAAGSVTGNFTLQNAEIFTDDTLTVPATLFVLGVRSKLVANESPVVTLQLVTDAFNNTTLTTTAGGLNNGKIILSSSRDDRFSRLEFGEGFVNSVTGTIEAIAAAGGDRLLSGRLVNQGKIVSTGIVTIASGTYEAAGGTVEEEVNFWNARIVPVTPTIQPTELKLYGTGSVLAQSNIKNLILRVISEVSVNSVLTLDSNVVNAGTIRLESLRSDRSSSIAAADGVLVNGAQGIIISTPENGGGRQIRGELLNRGLIRLDHSLTISQAGADHANFGRIELGGQTLTVTGASFLNAQGGKLIGSGGLNVTGAPFTNEGIIAPGASPGLLTIQGNYTQGDSGWVDIELAGPESPGVGHDAIQVTGSVTINGGRLLTRLIDSYLPSAETRFRVVSATQTVSGRFAEYPNLQVHPERFLQPEYLPNALDLRVLQGVDATLPPSIAVHPASREAAPGEQAEFLVSVNGVGPFIFEWYRNGQLIPGAVGSKLTLSAIQEADYGNYYVIVKNAAGSSTSQSGQLSPRGGQQTQYDYGDAPDTPYPTLSAHNGATQRVNPGFTLGPAIDADPGTLQNSTATADGADDDGVIFLDPLIVGQTAKVRVLFNSSAQVSGLLTAWIDWLADGSWSTGDVVIANQVLNKRTNEFTINVPAGATAGLTFARFRLYADNYPGVSGKSEEPGEVEDYQVEIQDKTQAQGTADFGDAPDSYKTLLVSNGPRHGLNPELHLGQLIDLENDGIPGPLAKGDDLTPAGAAGDEDGLIAPGTFTPGAPATVSVIVTGSGQLDGWFDFNRDGDFADGNEKIINNISVSTGTRNFSFNVPATAVSGGSFIRLRLSTKGGLSYDGPAEDGEVEDYAVTIRAQSKDWGDAPEQGTSFPTTLGRNGARHSIVQGFYLGERIDSEPDGQPNANATGDDLATPVSPDDEDGVELSTPLIPGERAEIIVTASQPGLLDAWVDFQKDGSWLQAVDRIFTNRTLTAGQNVLIFDVPATAAIGPTFARFRLSRNGLNSFEGDGGEGEVEDYRVNIEQPSDCQLGCEGTDFWFTFPANFAPDPAYPLTPRIRVTGANGTAITVSIPGLATTITTNITGTSVTVTLPIEVDLGTLNDAVLNRGIHLTASAPVGVHAISQVKYSSDGFLALPTEVLTGQYIVSAYPNVHVGVPEISGSQFAIVATQPNTIVTITPSIETGLRVADFPYSITLTNAGDCYQLRNDDDAPADLTGTIIEADKPVAVFAGHIAANVNSSSLFFADYVVEQMTPVERLATEFFVAPLDTRSGGETVRIVASQDDTLVTIGGDSITLTNRGDVYEVLLPDASHISANKPVYLAQFASSSDFDGVVNADPFMVTIPGRSHFGESHTFATAGPNFLTHHVTVIAPASVDEITVNGVAESPSFSSIGASGYRYAHRVMAQGVHTISAAEPIGIIVYGWNEYESYGWPSCLNFGDTTPPQITCPTNRVTIVLGQQQQENPCIIRVPDLRQEVSYRDDCGMPLDAVVTQTPAPGTLLGVGVHEVTLSVSDNAGNVGHCTIVVTVVDPTPGDLVSFQCPADFTVRCKDENGAVVNYTVEALRGCTPISVVCTPPPGALFPVGTTKVTCRINEPGLPVQECSFNVTVDCQKPRLVEIKPSPTNPNDPSAPREIILEWAEESGIYLEVADNVTGPWTRVDGVVNRYVIRVAKESGKFFRLKGN